MGCSYRRTRETDESRNLIRRECRGIPSTENQGREWRKIKRLLHASLVEYPLPVAETSTARIQELPILRTWVKAEGRRITQRKCSAGVRVPGLTTQNLTGSVPLSQGQYSGTKIRR